MRRPLLGIVLLVAVAGPAAAQSSSGNLTPSVDITGGGDGWRPVVARGPGLNTWNMSLFKNVKAGGHARMQFRVEAYNVFNTPQFSAVDTTPRFDAQGNQVSGTFGQITAARDPRILQFALRVTF